MDVDVLDAQAYALRIGSKYSEAAGCGENITHGDDDARIACLRMAPLAHLQAAALAATKLPPTATPFDEIGWGLMGVRACRHDSLLALILAIRLGDSHIKNNNIS